jgi:hypothetical protein
MSFEAMIMVMSAFDDIIGDNPPILDNNQNDSNPSSGPFQIPKFQGRIPVQ